MTTNFLPKDPTLTKKEQETSFSFANEPYNKLYTEGLGSQLFEGVKVKRKESSMPKLKFKPLNIETYNQLAINKYNPDSPLAGAVADTGAGSTDLSIQTPKFKSFSQPSSFESLIGKVAAFGSNPFRPEEEKVSLEEIGTGVKEVAGEFASTAVGLIDIPLQQFAKAGAGTTTVGGGTYYFAQEFVDSLPSLEDVVAFGSNPFRPEEEKIDIVPRPDFMKAAIKTEELKQISEWFFGTKLEYGDYLDVRSSHEKRTEMFNEFPTHMQEQLSTLDNWALAFDVTAGILSGVAATKAPLTLANKVGVTTTLGKNMIALDRGLGKVVDQIPKLGVAYGAAALAYYQQTGKWLFEGDEGATEGSAMFIASAGLRGLGKLGTKGWEMSSGGRQYIKDMVADPDFQKGVRIFFDEAKNAFADEIDKVAVKVGARTNLLPSQELLEASAKEVKEFTPDQALIDGALNKLSGGLKHSVKKKPLRDKFIDSGLIGEADSLFTGIRRAFKKNTIGKFVKLEDELFGERAGDRGVDFFLNPADRKVGTILDMKRVNGEISFVQNKLEDTILAARNNLGEFNSYLFAKSRFFKTRGKGVATKILDEKGAVTDVSLAELEQTYKSLDGKYGKLADNFYSEYDTLLKREVEAGMRTPDDLAKFAKTNPFYIGDKELNPEEILKIGPESLSANIPKKTLTKDGVEVLKVNSIDNAFGEISYRYEALNRIEKLNKAQELAPDLIKELVEGTKPTRGNIAFNTLKDGKTVRMEGPKFWVEDIFNNDNLSATTVITALPRAATRMFKEFTTGRASILSGYPVIAPLLELPPAMLRSLAEGKGGGEFYKSLLMGVTGGKIRTGIGRDPAVADGIENLAKQMGATFTQTQQLSRELKESLGTTYSIYTAKKSAFARGKEVGTKVLDLVDIGNVIEKKTIRIPLFTQGLVKQGLTEKKAQELLKQAGGKPNEFRKLLEKAGISPELAADSAVNVFDYYGVTKTARKVGSMVAYFNSAASQAKSTKTLFEKNPRLMSMMMSGGALLSHQIYNFNTNTPEKKAAYDQMPAYRRNSPMLYMGKNEKNEDVFIKMVRGLQILDWSYPLYIESKDSATKSGFNFEEAFSKMFEDTVGIKPNPADWGQYLPAVVKQGAENVTGFNMFFKSHRNVSADAKQFATQDFDKNTSRVAMGMSRTFAKITGGVEGPDGVIRGGIQFSPIKVDNLMNSADNGTVRGIAGKFLFKSEREGKIDKKELFNVVGHFKKLGNEQRNSKGIFEERNKAKAESSARNRNIDRILLESEDLGESIKELISLYPKSADTIKRKVKKAIKQDLVSDILKNENPLYVRDLITTSSFNNAEIAQVYNGRLTDEGEKKADKFLVDMVKSGLITKDKLKTIYREIFTSQ